MNIAAPFIDRPVATTLLTLALALAGCLGFSRLSSSPMPQIDLPGISVSAQMPGADPETMATAVATPLERHLGTIAGVTGMGSYSSTGSTEIDLGFALDRDLDGAARDVAAAINAARTDLPANLRGNPTYDRAVTASGPITYLSLTSKTMRLDRIYEIASTILQPQLAAVAGVGHVDVLGSSGRAIRVELNPSALAHMGIGFEDIRAALAAANANTRKGAIDEGQRRLQISTNDQGLRAKDYRDLIIAYRNGLAVRLSEVAEIQDSVADLYAAAVTDRSPSILLRVYRQPGANVIETVDRLHARLDLLRAVLPPAIEIAPVSDRTATIRSGLRELEAALVIAGAFVILTVFAFLRSLRAIAIPAIVVPVSILGTLAIMAVLHYSLDSLSLMALIIATGLVIDDSVIVLENVSRYIESGIPRREAALKGVREVGFTVLAMSLSLVAIFIPLLFMGDVIGRILREFAVTLSSAVLISLAVSLTTAPMLCARLLKPFPQRSRGFADFLEHGYDSLLRAYEKSLKAALRHPRWTLAGLIASAGLNIALMAIVPKDTLPEQDPGWLIGEVDTTGNMAGPPMKAILQQTAAIILADPEVHDVNGMITGQDGSAELHILLKPRSERTHTASEIADRLWRVTRHRIPGADLWLSPPQDVHLTLPSRGKETDFQYELRGDDLANLRIWAAKLIEALKTVPEIVKPCCDERGWGLETHLALDRDTIARLGLSVSQVENTLYDAFGQRQVSTIYGAQGTQAVIMEVAPRYRQTPRALDDVYVSTAAGNVSGTAASGAPAGSVTMPITANPNAATVIATDSARNQVVNALANSGSGATSTGPAVSTGVETMIPLMAIAHYEPSGASALAVGHSGNAVASTIRFHSAVNVAPSEAMAAVARTAAKIHLPASIQSRFTGEAEAFHRTLIRELLLILAAVTVIYIVLGMLYESFIHPITILSTLPSAGVGAILALMMCHLAFTLIAFIGVLLLIGIVMKNAIMIIDVTLQLESEASLSPTDAVYRACLLRFRPILMTSCAALLGALPLTLGIGDGAELRQPLGISIVGGLILSQILTLYTTPIVYLYLARLSTRPPKQSVVR